MIVEQATELLHGSVGGFYLYDAEHEEVVSTFATSTIMHIGTRLKLGEGAMDKSLSPANQFSSTTIEIGKDVHQDLKTFPSVRCWVSPCFLAEN